MSDDFNKAIRQITDILGQENVPDNVQTLLSLLVSGGDKKPVQEQNTPLERDENPEGKSERSQKSSSSEKPVFDGQMMRRALELMNTRDDPKVNLLMAVKPFLNNSRQKNLNHCIKLVSLTKVLGLLEEFQDGKES